MRLRTLILSLVLASAGLHGGAALAETTYGQGVHGEDTTPISVLLANPDQWVGKTVRVKGRVTDVCQKRGCWVAIASDQEFQTLRFKVKDGEIVFPQDVKGRVGVFEGVFNRYELSREQAIARAKHHAEEHGEKFDPSEITGPEVWYQLDGTGAVVE